MPVITGKFISLTRGYRALVSPEDYGRLSQHKWCTKVDPGRYVYVKRAVGPRANHQTVLMHREILQAPAGSAVDHINAAGGLMPDGFTIDNRRGNLRLATHRQNSMNTNAPETNTTGFKGVSPDKVVGKYRAVIRAQNRQLCLGRFATKEQAALAYDQAARQLHDLAFIRLNFPERDPHDVYVQRRIDRILRRATLVCSRSGHRHICWHAPTGMWRVIIPQDGKRIYLGNFKDIDGAQDALDVFQIQRLIEHAVNWPEHFEA